MDYPGIMINAASFTLKKTSGQTTITRPALPILLGIYSFTVKGYLRVISNFSCCLSPHSVVHKSSQFYLLNITRTHSFSLILGNTAVATVHQLSPPSTLSPQHTDCHILFLPCCLGSLHMVFPLPGMPRRTLEHSLCSIPSSAKLSL